MNISTIEERLTQLEKRVDELAQAKPSGPIKDWRRTVGMFRDDPVMKEVIDEALRAREAERAALRDQPESQP